VGGRKASVTYYVGARNGGGKELELALGKHPTMTFDTARQRARSWARNDLPHHAAPPARPISPLPRRKQPPAPCDIQVGDKSA